MMAMRWMVWCLAAWMAWPVLAGEPTRTSPALFIAGQSREEFADYLENVSGQGRYTPMPAGAAFYTSLHLTGLDTPHANEPGDFHQDLWYLERAYQPLVIQIGLWLGRGELYEIEKGGMRDGIKRLASRLNRLERPVFLRIGYEFDGPHNHYPPEPYINAYRIIGEEMRAYPNILLVWHSFALIPTFEDHDVMAWYPGDEWVDWIAVSFFQVGTEGYYREPNRDRLVEIARERNKPLMIAEASAIRYTKRQKTLTGEAYWEYWYQPFFDFIEANEEVKAASMINVDWESQRQHAFLDWSDCRIQSDPYVLARWREKLQAPYWIHREPDLYERTLEFSGPPSERGGSHHED